MPEHSRTQGPPPGLMDPNVEALPPRVALEGADGAVLRAVPYAVRPGYRPLLADVYLPRSSRPAPVVLYLHGGGWQLGSRSQFCPSWSDWRPDPFARLVAAGFAVVSADYRFSGEALFPAQLDDVMAALRWMRRRAGELSIDADRVVVWGESAGGHLAALLGLSANRDEPGAVAGVVDWYGPADLTTTIDQASPDSREALLIGAAPRDAPDRAREASPVAHVHEAAPPFLLAHGTADRFVPAAQSQQLAAALREVGVPAELDLVPGADHLWREATDPERIFARALDFAAGCVG